MFQHHLHVVVGGTLNAPGGVVNDPLRGIATHNGHPQSFHTNHCIDVQGNGISYGPVC
jgi:hypothetical protein